VDADQVEFLVWDAVLDLPLGEPSSIRDGSTGRLVAVGIARGAEVPGDGPGVVVFSFEEQQSEGGRWPLRHALLAFVESMGGPLATASRELVALAGGDLTPAIHLTMDDVPVPAAWVDVPGRPPSTWWAAASVATPFVAVAAWDVGERPPRLRTLSADEWVDVLPKI
jgi:hypothetical protein